MYISRMSHKTQKQRKEETTENWEEQKEKKHLNQSRDIPNLSTNNLYVDEIASNI